MNKDIHLKNLDIKGIAAYVSDTLKANGISAILVGGSCVSIYTHNQYQSYDLDFVTFDRLKNIRDVLEEVGFQYDSKKYFKHPDTEFFVEFVSPPVSVGGDLVEKTNQLEADLGVISLLSPTDCVKDRLAAYFHWNDRESLEQALMVARSQPIDTNELFEWAKRESSLNKYNDFQKRLDDK